MLDTGESVIDIQPGDTVIASFQPSCGTCPRCGSGYTSVCGNVPNTSMYGVGAAGGSWGGALSDQLRVPWADFNLRRIPDRLDPVSIASGSDNIADGLRAVDKPLQAIPEASVLIAGAGSIALYAVQFAAMLGAQKVTFAGRDRFALETAEALGADCIEVSDWPRRFTGHEITFDCTNDPNGLAAVTRSTAPFGIMTSASIYFDPATPLPLADMYMKGITFNTGRVNSAAQLDRVLELLEAGFDPDAIKPNIVCRSQAIEAFADTPYSQKLIITL